MSRDIFERYEAYKDSEVEWFREAPKHWVVTRNKDIFEERGALSISGDETLLTVSHITGVTRRTEKNVNMFMAETMEGYKLCNKGDLIINTMWAWMGALGTANEDGICSPAYGVYKPKKFQQYNHRYFDYLYRTPNAISEMTRRSKGIVSSRLRLYPRDFFQIQTTLPSEIEQTAIANYLDEKTAKIDRKIDLLSQKATQYDKLKQSLINETVTRGLNKTVEMKDSGVKMIGEVPGHWEIKRGKDVFIENKKSPFSASAGEDEGGYPFFTSSQEQTKWINEAINNKESLIFGTGGSANIHYCNNDFSTSSDCYVIHSKYQSNKYFYYYFRAIIYEVDIIGFKGAGLEHLQKDFIKLGYLPKPPHNEQVQITNYLDDKTTQIDRIVNTINTQIEKLKELCKSLINDVVTGKIKVVKEGQAA